MGLTNHSAFLNVAILCLILLCTVDRESKCANYMAGSFCIAGIYSPGPSCSKGE